MCECARHEEACRQIGGLVKASQQTTSLIVATTQDLQTGVTGTLACSVLMLTSGGTDNAQDRVEDATRFEQKKWNAFSRQDAQSNATQAGKRMKFTTTSSFRLEDGKHGIRVANRARETGFSTTQTLQLDTKER